MLGGNGKNGNGYAGSGGRVVIALAAADESLINQRIIAYGGYNPIVATTPTSINGASGTFYMKGSNYLNIVAKDDNVKTTRKTPLDSAHPENPPNLYADGPVNISPSKVNISFPFTKLQTNSSFPPEISEISEKVEVYFVDVATFSNSAQFVSIISETISTTSSVFLYATSLNLTDTLVSPYPQGADNFLIQVDNDFTMTHSTLNLQKVNQTIVRFDNSDLCRRSRLELGPFLNMTGDNLLNISSISQAVISE